VSDKRPSGGLAAVRNCHFGCGNYLADHYINIDVSDTMFDAFLETNKVYLVPNRSLDCYFLRCDITLGVPLPSDYYQTVYHCHFLEHLDNQQGWEFLKECWRILAPGGTMRVVVPDLELWCKSYVEKRMEFLTWYQTQLDSNPTLYSTPGQILMGHLQGWQHKMAYDFDTLEHLLTTLGFTNIVQGMYGVSNVPEIEFLEKDPVRERESVCVECVKPLTLENKSIS